jgi:hypothetical protein
VRIAGASLTVAIVRLFHNVATLLRVKEEEERSMQAVKTTPHIDQGKKSHFSTVKILYQQTKKA